MDQTKDSSLETVRKAYEAFGKGDIPAVVSLLAPDVEWRFPDAQGLWFEGTHHGPREVVERVFAGIGEHMQKFRIDPEQLVAVGNHIAVTGRVNATSKSGRPLDAPYFQLWRVENGRATHVAEYHERESWLAALGS
jgi:ketosteroid isomerase-like protein